MSNEIVKVEAPKEISIEQVTTAKEAFRPTFEAMAELEPRYIALTDIKLAEPSKEQCGEARAVRLLLVKTRTGTSTTHKTLKADALIYGRYLDGMKKAQLIACEKRESDLVGIENHYENIERIRIEKLNSERSSALTAIGVEFIPAGLAQMDVATWENCLAGYTLAEKSKKEAAEKEESDRVKKEKEEAEENERIRIENEKLKKEAAERDAAAATALQAEREEREKLERENATREEHERKAREAKESADLEESKRVADLEHRLKVEDEILDAIGAMGEPTHLQILIAIKAGEIPNLTINY